MLRTPAAPVTLTTRFQKCMGEVGCVSRWWTAAPELNVTLLGSTPVDEGRSQHAGPHARGGLELSIAAIEQEEPKYDQRLVNRGKQ